MPGPAALPDNLFAALPKALSEALLAHARPVELQAEQTLFVAGDAGDGCYSIETGLLKVSVVSAAGNERILAILGAGALVGELSLLDGRPRSATVTALRPSRLGFIGRGAFDAVLGEDPELWREVAYMLAIRLRESNLALAATSFLPLQGRVARALLALADAFGEKLAHPPGAGRVLVRQKVTQSDLAAMAGIARENVSRILNGWLRDEVVSRISGYYCLEKPATLAALTKD
jgi:CRP-like cAMP-binding protein